MNLLKQFLILVSIVTLSIQQAILDEVAWGINSPLLVLPGFFPITNASAPGGINMIGFQMAESFKCAVKQLNATQLIPGLQIQAQVADSSSGLATAARLAAFTNRYLQPDKLYAFIFGSSDNYADMANANGILKGAGASLIHYFVPGSSITESTTIGKE